MLDIERKIKQRARRSERRTNGYPDFKKSWRLSAETAEMMMSTAQQNTHIMQRHLLIRRDGNEFHSLFRVHSTTSWASTIQVFFDMVPAEAANLSYLVAKQKKTKAFFVSIPKFSLSYTLWTCQTLCRCYLVAAWTGTEVSVRDVEFFHAKRAVKVFFVGHHVVSSLVENGGKC